MDAQSQPFIVKRNDRNAHSTNIKLLWNELNAANDDLPNTEANEELKKKNIFVYKTHNVESKSSASI